MKKYFCFLIIIILVACGQNKTEDVTIRPYKSSLLIQDSLEMIPLKDSDTLIVPERFTPLTFIEEATNKSHTWISTTDTFPVDWVQFSDLDTLMKLISVSEKCNCFVSTLSSYLPKKNDAEIGGYAIAFINSYRKKKQMDFGLYSCPTTDKKSVDELIKWWKNYKNTKGIDH